MDPRAFYNDVVLPNVADAVTQFGDMRHAFNATMSVDALAARIFLWCQSNAPSEISGCRDDDDYRGRLAGKSEPYALVREMAKAQKHAVLTRRPSTVAGANKISGQSLGWGQVAWGEGRFGGALQAFVEVTGAPAGTPPSRAVDSLVQRAATFLESEMTRLGIP